MTKQLKDDPRSRIYVGQDFVIGDIAEPLISALERFLKQYPDALAMLEFTSPGPNNRQIDCALVSRGGIDLIEVKDKQGVVEGSADGPWTVRQGRRVNPVSNTKSGKEENPYQQASNTAEDLKKGLRKLFTHKPHLRVTPLVFLPSADPASFISDYSNVKLALGERQFQAALRSAPRSHDGGWNGLDHFLLPNLLHLKPMNLSFIQGRITDAFEHQALPNVEVWANVNGEQLITHTDKAGTYRFAAAWGSEVQLSVIAPDRYLAPETTPFRADMHYLNVADLRLADRYERKTEEQLRAEVRREMEARIEEQVRQMQAAWTDTQLQMGLVIDDLNTQLRQAAVQLQQRDRQAKEALRLGSQQRLPLPIQVRQATLVQSLGEQRQQVQEALADLQTAQNTEQQQAVQQAFGVLTRVALSARLELERPRDSALPVLALKTSPRVVDAPELQDLGEPELVEDAKWSDVSRERPTAARHDTRPSSATLTAQPPRRVPMWVWGVGFLMAAGLGAGLTSQLIRPQSPAPLATPTPPAPVTVAVAETTPAEPASEQAAAVIPPATKPVSAQVTLEPVAKTSVATPTPSPATPVPTVEVSPSATAPTNSPTKTVVAKPVTTPAVQIPTPAPARRTVEEAAPAQAPVPAVTPTASRSVAASPTSSKPVAAAVASPPPVVVTPPAASAPRPAQTPQVTPPAAVVKAITTPPTPAPKPVVAPSTPVAPAVSNALPQPTADSTNLPGEMVDVVDSASNTDVTSETDALPGVPVE
ncbi:nuclease-related domain-containing protein [Deinococcus aquatilis]|uniref:nuclease-related domain-containing protein n=1 Tax=Deinococcus aquatilis TaxID=519440 RepID=UPI00035FD52C|nr:nuclease-related domain-containing protein [Deinococcus aquatilis]